MSYNDQFSSDNQLLISINDISSIDYKVRKENNFIGNVIPIFYWKACKISTFNTN